MIPPMQALKAVLPTLLVFAAANCLAAQGAGGAPPTGQCMETDYDCQPTAMTEKQYDSMALSVPVDRDLPALVELDPLDPPGTPIRRYMLNARGIMGREVPIADSKDQFCTLSHATNVTLTYFPASGLWTFVIGFNQQAELMAGGLATCLDLRAVAPGARP
jgi:hypothetical protein